MNRQTYPVYCGWCSALVRTDGPVKGSTGICSVCKEQLRKESDAQFASADRTIRFDLGLSSQAPWTDEYTDQRRALIHESWHKPSSFWDGFVIGAATATLLLILVDYFLHRPPL